MPEPHPPSRPTVAASSPLLIKPASSSAIRSCGPNASFDAGESARNLVGQFSCATASSPSAEPPAFFTVIFYAIWPLATAFALSELAPGAPMLDAWAHRRAITNRDSSLTRAHAPRSREIQSMFAPLRAVSPDTKRPAMHAKTRKAISQSDAGNLAARATPPVDYRYDRFFAAAVSSSRNLGCASAVSAFARSETDLPLSIATPYSETT